MLSRRKLFAFAAGVGISALLPVGYYATRRKQRFIAKIQGILKDNLPGVAIAENDVENFAEDFYIQHNRVPLKPYALSVLNPITRKAVEHDVLLYGLIYDFEREVVSNFLLNSDFFMPGADQSHVNYQGKIDKLCSTANPFAQFGGES